MSPRPASYLDLPPLGGVCSFAEAQRIGYGVEASVALLKRYHYTLKRLFGIFLGRIPGIPIYELKMGLSYHSFLASENVTSLGNRIGEMREPPLGLDDPPEAPFVLFFDEIEGSSETVEVLIGLYGVAVSALLLAVRQHLVATNPLVDQPTVRVLRHLRLDLEEMEAWGAAVLIKLIPALGSSTQAEDWRSEFMAFLDAAGSISGAAPRPEIAPCQKRSVSPSALIDKQPRRDERFPDPFNASLNPDAFLTLPECPAGIKNLMLLFKRIREIDVPEMMSSLIAETKGKPWAYYRDMTRQLWDEARHAMMGEVGLLNLQVDWHKMKIPHTWSYELNKLLVPLQRHAILYSIEQRLMAKTGKRFEWEIALESGDALSATFHDFDWADEVLHSQIGRKWYASEFENSTEAKGYVEQSYRTLNETRPDYKALSLTEGENWWPEFYGYVCPVLSLTYDEKLAYFGSRCP